MADASSSTLAERTPQLVDADISEEEMVIEFFY
jgi:hypothetical protein